MKNRKVIILALLSILILFLIFSQILTMEKRIDLEAINLQDTNLPTMWTCDWCKDKKDVHLDWEYNDALNDWGVYYEPVSFSTTSDTKLRQFSWFDKNTSNRVIVIVVDYSCPLLAKLNYSLNDPRGVFQRDFWNFIYDKENMHPSKWVFQNPEADKDTVLCGSGSENNCEGWFYTARYGQYYILVHSYMMMNGQVFENIVKVITDKFEKYLDLRFKYEVQL